MATFNEISYDILEILKNNQISDDTDISLEHILYHVNNHQAIFLKLIEVDAAECCSVDIGCIALRTEKKLPALLELHSGPAIQRVGPVNKLDTPYSVTTGTVSSFRKYNKYTGNDIQAVYLNDYIYIIASTPADQGIKYINARVIAADPSDLLDYRCDSTSTPCFSFDDQYPINNWMIPYVKEQILKQFGMSLQIPKDEDNNAKDNISK